MRFHELAVEQDIDPEGLIILPVIRNSNKELEQRFALKPGTRLRVPPSINSEAPKANSRPMRRFRWR